MRPHPTIFRPARENKLNENLPPKRPTLAFPSSLRVQNFHTS